MGSWWGVQHGEWRAGVLGDAQGAREIWGVCAAHPGDHPCACRAYADVSCSVGLAEVDVVGVIGWTVPMQVQIVFTAAPGRS